MESNDKKLFNVSTTLQNTICMMLYLLTAFIAMSVGLCFFYLVAERVGFGVGVAMFVIASLIFALGELMFFANMGKIKMHKDE